MSMEYAQACYNSKRSEPGLANRRMLLDARADQYQANTGDEKHDGDGRGDLNVLFLIHGGFERANLRHFFLLVIAEVRMDQPHDAADQQDHSEDDYKALHVALNLSQPSARRGEKTLGIPLPRISAKEANIRGTTQERLAAAAAFLAAFAAAEALRRRLVLGGVAGASPISSADMMLVTKSLGP